MNKAGLTWSASIHCCEGPSRGRMAGLALVLLARIYERVGVAAESIAPSAIQYRTCCLPPPALITIYPSRFSVVGS